MKRSLSILSLVFLISSLLCHAAQIVTIPDAALEDAFQFALKKQGKEPITDEDLARLTTVTNGWRERLEQASPRSYARWSS